VGEGETAGGLAGLGVSAVAQLVRLKASTAMDTALTGQGSLASLFKRVACLNPSIKAALERCYIFKTDVYQDLRRTGA
jgi:hypothetical protein